MAYFKQGSTFSVLFKNNNNNNNNNNNDNNNAGSQDDKNLPETSDEAEVDEVSEELPFMTVTYTVFGNDDDVDDEDFMMPNTVEEYDEPDQDAIALEHAPLANGAGPNGPIEDD
ncbi:hypothetical protein EC957_004464 [Mortierella hygrophila]|uniref:Uncharacterized protein n=1 Tax=Mortierella hygrophila TaxID=979708 RepID=A0A9P6F270_9FUNG|nr:hypothetical protein EC957_004464 [Mortierella hygrophila]